jgi:hypothetical protein
MTEIDLSCAGWHKNSYSGPDGDWVEVTRNLPGSWRCVTPRI